MVLSKHLPTAVDFTNSLVNYIEVQALEAPSTSAPQVGPSDEGTDPLIVPTPVAEYIAKEGVHPPLVLPPTPEIAPLQEPSAAQQAAERKAAAGRFMSDPPKQYHSVIPQFFQDTDAPENSEQFNRAISLTDSLPVPPSLPMFLNRSILNNSTPMKDDASVLVLPNHTVLNHLATSSIRNHVIATSATTRYRKKVFRAD
jgi:5'-AMP-activated protein kinase beta subunit, interaction domain